MTQESIRVRASEDDGMDVRSFINLINKFGQLGGYIFSEQSMLTAIDAHNQGRAVFLYFQSCFVGLRIVGAEIAIGAANRGKCGVNLHS
jgi:hypothetical protein